MLSSGSKSKDMNSTPSRCSEADLAEAITAAGVYCYGVAEAAPVEQDHIRAYTDFIASGRHGSMHYLERYADLRSDPRTLLPGASSVISCAISYYTPGAEPTMRIARYARGADYHTVVRERLEQVARYIRQHYGGETRVCTDTAPIFERYWAVKAGVGFIGRNHQLIIPGAGSYFFLGEILTTAHMPASKPCADGCSGCGRCSSACPTGALAPDGTFDARRCLSYLTIEHRGELPPGTNLHHTFYGCDRCAEACPHNATPPATTIEDFQPREAVMTLTPEDMMAMDHARYAETFRGSAMKRAKIDGLKRNAQIGFLEKNA